MQAADRVLDASEAAMVRLAKNPGLGHWREDLTDKRHRFFLVYSYLIVYRHETKPLQIIRVLHAARNVQSILGVAPDDL
jgi:antitoxin ParD1/3/4/toxin ParE1/3/4